MKHLPHGPPQDGTAQPQRTSRFAFDARIDSLVASALDENPLSEALCGSAFADDPLAGSPPVDDPLSAAGVAPPAAPQRHPPEGADAHAPATVESARAWRMRTDCSCHVALQILISDR